MLDRYLQQVGEHYGREIVTGRSFLEVHRLADEEAQRLIHGYVGTEHQLLGLIREGSNPTLDNLGFKLDTVRSYVEQIIGKGDRAYAKRQLTPRAKKVVELSVDEALRLGDMELDSGHLLLGLVREGQGMASGIIESMEVGCDRVRRAELERRYALVRPPNP